MIFEAEWEAGIPVEWSHAWLKVCGFLEQAKWRLTTFLCRDTNPFFVLILSVGLHSLSNIGLRSQLSLFYVLRHFSLSVVCEEAPILASIAVGSESGGVVVPLGCGPNAFFLKSIPFCQHLKLSSHLLFSNRSSSDDGSHFCPGHSGSHQPH